MIFEIFGPFQLPRRDRQIDDSKLGIEGFWASVGEEEEGLSGACGCYVFAMRAGQGIVPWYVGLTSKMSFRRECFQTSKLLIYSKAVHATQKGAPLLYLVAKRTPGGKFGKASKNSQRDIVFLENVLIRHGLKRNEALFNRKKTKFLKTMRVPGILNSTKGKPSRAVISLRRALGL
jgi:hypothetical protein